MSSTFANAMDLSEQISALLPQAKLLVLLDGNAMYYERLQGEHPFMKNVGKQVLNSSKAECLTF